MGLPETFSRLRLAESARAETNLGLLRPRLPEELLNLLPTVLGQVPDPDTALNNLERFTGEAPGRVLRGLQGNPVLLHYLLAFFSYSRYLTETLIRQPELILWIEREKFLTRLKTKEDLLEGLARFEATALDSDLALMLARYKRREYLRIALKDILRLADLTETTLELSVLADVLVEKALRIAGKELERRTGWPHTTDEQGRPVRARFAVVSLGKLGGNELNYSSDIDLLFLYDGEGVTPGGETDEELASSEFFLRLGQRILQQIAGLTPEGAVFRVDMRLRPGGGEGDLVVSLPAAVEYYSSRAREWELQMLLKARTTAGNGLLVREFMQAVEPFLYRDEMHFDVVESVLQAREQIDQKLGSRSHDLIDVKLSPGGIRDIEFLVQCLQRLHGRTDRWLRSRGTMLGLQRLTDKGYLTPRDHHALASAYQFLRLVEHRLQLDQGQQTHQVPEEERAVELLARRCRLTEQPGGKSGESSALSGFEQMLGRHRQAVREIYRRVLPRSEQLLEAEAFVLHSPEAGAPPHGMEYAPLLSELRKRSEELHQAILNLEIPEGTRKAFHRFLAAAMTSPDILDGWERELGALPLAVEIFSRSEPMGELLIRQPERVLQLTGLCQPGGEEAQLPVEENSSCEETKLLAETGQAVSLPERMRALRLAYRDQLFRWGVLSLQSKKNVAGALYSYSHIARQFVERAWQDARQLEKVNDCPVVLVALGRLGTGELDLGSDLDLVYVAQDQAAIEAARPVVEKFIHLLSAYTQEGTLFQVDSRLRPLGKEGELVQTAEGTLEYFRTRAQTWEAAAYLKAAPVLEGARGREWLRPLQEILAARFRDGGAIRDSLREMRGRLESEGVADGGEGNFKAGPGGVYDIDFILSALALQSGTLEMGGRSLVQQVELLHERDVLKTDGSKVLIRGARFFRTVDHAIRLVTGKSSPVLPGGTRGEVVAQLAGQWLGETWSHDTLLTQLADTRQAVRAVFERVFCL